MNSNSIYKHNLVEPPEELQNFVGGGDFRAVGEFFYHYLTKQIHLKPNESILDVGCGCGRIAYPLLDYLENGSYYGFDINKQCIDWCATTLTKYSPSFQFKRIDIYNKRYNPQGEVYSSDLVFPYENDTFDVVILTSVFTHLLEKDMLHYLAEIQRVLKIGGRCLITYFLFNEPPELENECRREITFEYDFGHYRLHDVNEPEHAIAFDETYIRNIFRENNLDIDIPIVYSLQDIIMATKTC